MQMKLRIIFGQHAAAILNKNRNVKNLLTEEFFRKNKIVIENIKNIKKQILQEKN